MIFIGQTEQWLTWTLAAIIVVGVFWLYRDRDE